MTCKDCYHYDVCHRRINSIDFLPVIKGKVSMSPIMYNECDDVEKYCSYFKDKSLIVELPCKVGDKIYCDGKYFAGHCAGKVMEFIADDIRTDVCTYHCGELDMIFDFSEFGKTVFLTKEEAEEKLKELNNEQD